MSEPQILKPARSRELVAATNGGSLLGSKTAKDLEILQRTTVADFDGHTEFHRLSLLCLLLTPQVSNSSFSPRLLASSSLGLSSLSLSPFFPFFILHSAF